MTEPDKSKPKQLCTSLANAWDFVLFIKNNTAYTKHKPDPVYWGRIPHNDYNFWCDFYDSYRNGKTSPAIRKIAMHKLRTYIKIDSISMY